MATVSGQYIFRSCKNFEQEYGGDNEKMLVEISVSIKIGGVVHGPYTITIKQIVGGKFEGLPLEVSSPESYRAPFNYEVFRDAAEKYYRSCIGNQAVGIRLGPGVRNITISGNVFVKEMRVDFEAEDPGHGW